jgi:hypothetical protein
MLARLRVIGLGLGILSTASLDVAEPLLPCLRPQRRLFLQRLLLP